MKREKTKFLSEMIVEPFQHLFGWVIDFFVNKIDAKKERKLQKH